MPDSVTSAPLSTSTAFSSAPVDPTDFPLSERAERGWIGQAIEDLDPALRFTFLNLGNPHLVAEVDAIDTEHLATLGERVKTLTELLPRGVNVSLFRHTADQEIYTATYERGVGLTSSCGTAMTACSTAACLLGLCRTGQPIRVRNSGGMVRCCCRISDGQIATSLSGNATYESEGVLHLDIAHEEILLMEQTKCFQAEIDQYEQFFQSTR
jgi:diaminopimelate epimerase